MKPLHDQRVENRKAMEEALQAPTIDPARIEQIRVEQMKVADQSSKRFTKALTDAGNVLTPRSARPSSRTGATAARSRQASRLAAASDIGVSPARY